MSGSGMIVGSYHQPHVYFIVARDVVYIGETQVIPVRRWSSHLDSTGSFTKKLKKFLDGESNMEYLNSLSFFSISCKELLINIEKHYCGYRIPTQALEHRIHELVAAGKLFGTNTTIISETKKTAPRNFYHWEYIDKIASKCVKKILQQKAQLEVFKLED